MSLSDYSRKRRFDKTPEPPPKPSQESGNRFCIQRHSARRLHYDLRLEVHGVLKSWAVPKGPTLDSKEKRLAVLVEDHPIEYGDFEGTIPAGNYGAGSVLLWDRGTYELLGDVGPEAQLERGDFKFKLHGEKLIGEFALVKMKNRGKGNEWLLLKKPDFAAQPGYDSENDLRSVGVKQSDPALIPGAVKASMPSKLAPMMAISSSKLPQGPDWVYEVKWDGVRALCFLDSKKDGKKVWAIGRSGRPIEGQYPEIAAIAEQFHATQAILDGEIVAFDENGIPSFAEIQPRIHGRLTKALQQSNPVTLFAFDLLYVDGVDLRGVALAERRRELGARLRPGGSVRLSDQFVEGAPLLDAARERGLEGVVAKRATSNYESKRSDCWVKVKVVTQQDFVICGMTSGERKPFGSLALGVYDDGELVYAGNVGSGFNDSSLRTLGARLKELVVKKCPFAEVPKIAGETTWVKPETVAAVKFMAWTKDDRLRAPVFLGVRDDVSPKECTREGEDPSVGVDAGVPARVAVQATPVRRSLLAGKAEEVHTIDGQQLKFSNLNKVFYPADGITKRDVINYYDAVSDLILPYLRERPLSLKRYPNGIDHDFFFQKNAAESFPSWLRTVPIESEERTIQFVVADDRATLLYLANLACIDQNPWMSRVGNLSNPDFVLIDLDPYHCGYDRIVEAAQLVRSKLELMGLQGFPKTTGGDGMHIYVPLEPVYNYEQVRSFAEIVSRIVTHERPDLFTTPRTVKQREKGKVYFDYLQIREGATISAPYVLRANPGAPVSTPLRWSEVQRGLSPQQFNVRNAPDRFARLGDLFAPVLMLHQRLETAIERLQLMMGASGKAKR
jgi:bifunctional non-homologous end joining protein LigD